MEATRDNSPGAISLQERLDVKFPGVVVVLTEFGEVRGVWGDLVVLRHDEEGGREGRGDGKELWSD